MSSPSCSAARSSRKEPTTRSPRTRGSSRLTSGRVMPKLLEVRGLNAWYGESHILHGVDFDVAEGELVTLLGRNGAGKTTTLKSLMGMVGRRQGSSKLKGMETIGLPSNRIARLGIAFCPEERGIF